MDKLISQHALSELLGISCRSIERMRAEGSGPVFIRATPGSRRGRVLYRWGDVERWLASRERHSTSDSDAR